MSSERRANFVPFVVSDILEARSDPESAVTPDDIGVWEATKREPFLRSVVLSCNPDGASYSTTGEALASLGDGLMEIVDRAGAAVTPFGPIVSAIAVAFLQPTDDLGHDFERLGADIDCNRMFIRCWLLQGRELAIEQRDGHEVLVPRG